MIYTALITPFKSDNSVDYDALKQLVLSLLKQGCNGFVVCGSSGESSTLTEEEMFEILSFVLKLCPKTVKIIFNCGTNDTIKTLKLALKSEKYPIEAIMLVTPYYNKPTQKGLYEHYAYIASRTSIPIVLYQVENRCAITFDVDTLKKLNLDYPGRFSLKYASNDLIKLRRIKKEIKDMPVFCGDDALIYEQFKEHIDGCISVIAHLVYKELDLFYKGEYKYDRLFKNISNIVFKQSNPIGIKYLLSKSNRINNILRLPLTPSENNEELDALFDKYF